MEKVGDEATQYFYSHLFLTHPEVRGMFPVSMAAQRDRFFTALGRIVSNVDGLAADATFVEQLGRDHRRFEVVEAHYPAAGASLLATLQYFLGAAWTEELAADWAEAFGAVAKIMIVAAEDDADVAPPWWEAEVISTERRSLDVAVVEIRPTQPFPFRAGQSIAVEVPQRPRLWRYYSPANAPRADGILQLHVQIAAGGQVSPALGRTVTAGERVRIGAPVGDRLTVDPAECGDLLLVAGGSGLAPLRAVIDQLDQHWSATGSGPAVHLFHGARMPWNLYDHHGLTELAARPWFSYTPVVSEDPSYHGISGLVGTAAAHHRPWHPDTALVCGPAEMVHHTVGELVATAVPAHRIRSEDFGAPSTQPTETPSR